MQDVWLNNVGKRFVPDITTSRSSSALQQSRPFHRSRHTPLFFLYVFVLWKLALLVWRGKKKLNISLVRQKKKINKPLPCWLRRTEGVIGGETGGFYTLYLKYTIDLWLPVPALSAKGLLVYLFFYTPVSFSGIKSDTDTICRAIHRFCRQVQ